MSNMNSFLKNLTLWLVIGLVGIFLYNIFNPPHKNLPVKEISYSDFLSNLEKGEIAKVHLSDNTVAGSFINQEQFITAIPLHDTETLKLLREHKVDLTVKPHEEQPLYMNLLISWFPMLLLIAVWIFFMRQMQMGGSNRPMAFGRSKAKLLSQQNIKVTFADIAGIEEAKEELAEIVSFLKDSQKFTRLGGRIPKGMLLVGPPGTGKTLLAKAIAGEANAPFFSISGSDFVEMFVGVGASRVRDLFMQAKKSAPCIIFIDEIDAVGRHRGAGLGGGHDEREQTLNQLLVEMDGFESAEAVIVIAATNRPDVLDPALLRPGRFDRQILVPTPDVKGREEILKVHAKKIKRTEELDLSVIAKSTPGFSGADLENLVNEAALLAARQNKEAVSIEDFEMAKDKVLMGTERKSLVLSENEKRITAYHEAGHALVAKLLPGTDPVHKVTIIPRGRALGVTQQLPQDDRHTYPKNYLLNNLTILMGGRVAEEIIFNEQTTGAGNDIERATSIARKMVCEWGMSEFMGPVAFGKKEDHVFLGKDFSQVKDYSEQTAQKIDDEVRRIVTEAHQKAHDLISGSMNCLNQIAKELLEKESLDAHMINNILDNCSKTNAK